MDYSKLDPTKDKVIIISKAIYVKNPDTFEIDIQRLKLLYTTIVIVKFLKKH